MRDWYHFLAYGMSTVSRCATAQMRVPREVLRPLDEWRPLRGLWIDPGQGHAEAAIAGLIVGASQHEIAETGESHKGLACGAELHPKQSFRRARA